MALWFRRHREAVAGIALGIVVGLALIALFVFVFSEDTVDGPQIDEVPTTSNAAPSTPANPSP